MAVKVSRTLTKVSQVILHHDVAEVCRISVADSIHTGLILLGHGQSKADGLYVRRFVEITLQ